MVELKIKEDRKLLFKVLAFITLISSILGFLFFAFITIIILTGPVGFNCSGEGFLGNLNRSDFYTCQLVSACGEQAVWNHQLLLFMGITAANFLEIFAGILLVRKRRVGWILYCIAFGLMLAFLLIAFMNCFNARSLMSLVIALVMFAVYYSCLKRE